MAEPGRIDPGLEDLSRSTFERAAAILGDPSLAHPRNTGVRAGFVFGLQRDYGNRYVQRLVDHIAARDDGGRVVKPVIDGGAGSESDAQRQPMKEEEAMGLSPLPEQAQRQPMEEGKEMLQLKPRGIGRQLGGASSDVEADVAHIDQPTGVRSEIGRVESPAVQRLKLSKLLPWNWFTSPQEEEAPAEEGTPEWTATKGEFTAGRELGKGAYGTVYQSEVGGEEVAGKVPKATEESVEMLLEEEALMKRLPQMEENLIKYKGLAERTSTYDPSQRWPVLLMELAAGGDLKNAAEDIHKSEATDHEKRVTLTRLFKGALQGLAALQKGNLIHGDIKEDNILVGADWQCKIADIGGATVAPEQPNASTIEYQAPECKPRSRTSTIPRSGFSAKSDVWAMGQTFRNTRETLRDLFAGDGQFNDQFEDLLAKLQDDDPKKRPYAEQAAQQHPFFNWEQEEQTPAEQQVEQQGKRTVASLIEIFNRNKSQPYVAQQ